MEQQQQQQQQQQELSVMELQELGSKLDPPPSSKDALLKHLKQASAILLDLEQSPPASILESMQPFLKAIVTPELLRHQDKDVMLLVAACLCEITRITAPEAPYSDDILKDIFGLIVSTFGGLNETSGPAFATRVIILETLARYRSCVVMLDLECDDLINELFRTLFAVARDDHPENVLTSMRTILFVLLDESEEVHEDLLIILLSTLGRNRKDITEASRKLAMSVIESCSAKLEPVVKQLLISLMSGDGPTNCEIDCHEVIYGLYSCSPEILSGIVPYLTGELLNDQSEARLKAVNLVGKLFAVPNSVISEAFQSIFVEFLKRLTDRVVEVRMAVVDYVKKCLISNPSRPEAAQIFGALCDRLLDYDENVRKQVVAVVCDVACHNLKYVPVETTKLVAERLRDKSLLVKRYTLERLAEIYRLYCLKFKEGSANEYDWLPGKILRCFYDKDFRSDAIESIFCGALFPAEFGVKDIVGQWIRILTGLDKVEVKAMEKILEQKQRLQQEMQKYLSLKQTYKDADVADYQKKAILLFRLMSRFFTDPVKAEEGFLALDQLKDANIWRIFLSLLDPKTSFNQARADQAELLQILGEKHSLFDFLNVLSLKSSYMLFSNEHVKEILSELAIQKSVENSEACLSCVNMLVILASYSPLLLVGSEEDLLHLLEDDNEIVKEGILHVLARAGGLIREQLASSSSSVDLMLERLCLEGTRRQAKYAVHALAAITKDDGLCSLSVLCKKLVDMMEEKAHLPTVLQSLGCIAQSAMAVFETRESEIVEFIKINILQQSHQGQDKAKARWRDPSELCQLKIFGIKTLVKSYMPVKDAHLRVGIDSLIEVLRNMLTFGEISMELQSSAVDKAHLKLASAKAVLRLSRYWENKIPIDVFHLALRTVEINYRQARKLFLCKVHQYIKDRVLDAKYACAFLLDIFGSKHADLNEDKHNLADVIQMCRQVKARQLSLQSDTCSQLSYPEFMLPYLVHALAQHPMCPDFDQCRDVKAYEPLYRILYLFLSMVVHGDEDTTTDANNTDKGTDIIPSIASMLQCIKQSEDVLDPQKSKNSHGLSELGLLAVKRITQKPVDNQGVIESVSLPSVLYKQSDIKQEDAVKEDDLRKWLAEESVLAHFESLNLEVNGAVHLENSQDVLLEDIEMEGNEVPLGKLIKRIKSQKNKSKAVVKETSPPVEVKKDVDILQVVRDINLDNMGISIEPSNGHGDHISSKERKGEENHSMKRKGSNTEASPIPKRKRSLSARSPSKFSSSKGAVKPSVKASLKSPSPQQEEKKASQSELVVSPSKKKMSRRASERSDDSQNVPETDSRSKKKGKLSDKSNCGSNDDHSMGSLMKQKRKTVSVLAKCTSGTSHTTDLVDRRIKVWWPMDKRFYEGMVKSYDPDKKKHVVLYNDGEVEVLRLDKERWELADDGQKHKKKTSTVKSPSKVILSKKKTKLPEKSGQKGSNKRSSSAKGKRTQKKVLKSGNKGRTKLKAEALENVESKSDISNAEPSLSSDVDEPESGDHEQDKVDEVPASPACESEKPDTAEQDVVADSAGSSEGSEDEAHSGPESGHDREEAVSPPDCRDSDLRNSAKVDKNIEEGRGSFEKETNEKPTAEDDNEHTPDKSDSPDAEEAEDDEDEPLSIWKQRVGKSGQKA